MLLTLFSQVTGSAGSTNPAPLPHLGLVLDAGYTTGAISGNGAAAALSGSLGSIAGAGAAAAVSAVSAGVGEASGSGVAAALTTAPQGQLPAYLPSIGLLVGQQNQSGNPASLPSLSLFLIANACHGHTTGAAAVAALRGSVAATAGAGAALAASPFDNNQRAVVVAGNGTALALAGSLARAAGNAAVGGVTYDSEFFLSGSVAQGDGTVTAYASYAGIDYFGQAAGTGIATAISAAADGVGTVLASSSVLGEADISGSIGSLAATAGSASAVALGGSLADSAGTVSVAGFFAVGNIGQAAGAAEVLGYQPPLGQAQGDADCQGLAGSIAEAIGDGIVDGINYGNIGECTGESEANAEGVPSPPEQLVGGRGRHYKRKYVVVDDEIFEVGSELEAADLIRRLRDLAKEVVEEKTQEAALAQFPKLVKKPQRAKVKPPAPKISVSPDLQADVGEQAQQTQEELAALYKAAFDAKVKALLAQDEQDVADAIAAAEKADREMLNDILERIG